jgi:ketosteroid isomerase-like protein
MSQENVEIVRSMFEAVNRGDLDAWLEYWTDDIDYRAAEGAPDDHGPIKGKDALRAFVQDWLDTFDDFKVEPVELIDAGENNVIAIMRISGRAKLSGVVTDLTYAELSTLRDGIENPVQMTVGISDGERLWAVGFRPAGGSG